MGQMKTKGEIIKALDSLREIKKYVDSIKMKTQRRSEEINKWSYQKNLYFLHPKFYLFKDSKQINKVTHSFKGMNKIFSEEGNSSSEKGQNQECVGANMVVGED